MGRKLYWSSGMDGWIGGAATGGLTITLPKVKAGILHEILSRLRALDALVDIPEWKNSVVFCPEMMKWLLVEMLQENGVELLLHSLAVSVIRDDDRIKGIIVENKAGRQAILTKMVVDASGDADIAFFAGVPFAKGDSKGEMLPVTMMFMLQGVEEERFNTWYDNRGLKKKDELCATIATNLHHGEMNCWGGNLMGIDGLDPLSLTKAEITLRRKIISWIQWARKNVPGCERAFISLTAPQIGIRETRRIVGLYVLEHKDWKENREFEDLIGFTSADQPIPYRSLLPQRVDNLLAAGRCVSMKRDVLEEMREIPSCAVTGEAAGTAAALALKERIGPKQLEIRILKEALANQKVILERKYDDA